MTQRKRIRAEKAKAQWQASRSEHHRVVEAPIIYREKWIETKDKYGRKDWRKLGLYAA